MEYWQLVDTVNSKEAFLLFMKSLQDDWNKKHELIRRKDGADTLIKNTPWENCYLPDFLESMAGWIEDTDTLPDNFPFKALAEILTASTMYE